MDKISNVYYCTTPQKVGEVERIFKEIRRPNENLIILNIHLAIYFQNNRYGAAMDAVTLLIDNPDMAEYKAYLILKQGQISEFLGDFDSTLNFYCRTLFIGRWPLHVQYYLWNHISFCWLLKHKFKTAEWCCRKAIKLDPKCWDAWTNLGVSLEYQGKFIEALQCYLKTILLGGSKFFSILDLRRMIRHTYRAKND